MSNALNAAIYSKLTADTGTGGVNHSTAGALGGFHQGVAPPDATLPRIHFQKLTGTPEYSFQNVSARNMYYQFTAFAVDGNEEGATTAGRLAERAQALFTDPALTVTGSTVIHARPIREIPDGFEQNETDSKTIYSKGFILELWLA